MADTHTRGVKITVSQRAIDIGRGGDHEQCPIAYAIRWQFNAHTIIVTPTGVHWRTNAQRQDYALPRSARRFVRRVDARKPVTPFTFFLKKG